MKKFTRDDTEHGKEYYLASDVDNLLAQQSNEGFGYNSLKPYAFEAPNGELRKTAEAKDASEWGAKFKPLYEQQSNEQVEHVSFDAWYEKFHSFVGKSPLLFSDLHCAWQAAKLYTHPPVPYVVEPRTAQPKAVAGQHKPEQELLKYTVNVKCGRCGSAETYDMTIDTTPPQRPSRSDMTWVGLTPQERDEINEQVYGAVPHHVAFHAAIEAKLREKNSL